MKALIFAMAASGLFAPTAYAQSAQSAAPVKPAELGGTTPIETLMASAVAKPIVLKHFPGLDTHPAYEQIKGMSLRDVEPFSGGAITDEKIAALEADLKATK